MTICGNGVGSGVTGRGVCDGDGEETGVSVGVTVGVGDGTYDGVGVGVDAGVGVRMGVEVTMGVGDGAGVGFAVGVGDDEFSAPGVPPSMELSLHVPSSFNSSVLPFPPPPHTASYTTSSNNTPAASLMRSVSVVLASDITVSKSVPTKPGCSPGNSCASAEKIA